MSGLLAHQSTLFYWPLNSFILKKVNGRFLLQEKLLILLTIT